MGYLTCEYPTIDMKATGLQIKQLRKERNLSVLEVSMYMGFTEPQAVYKWERGESLPSIDNLFALSRLFGVSMDSIICEKNILSERVILRGKEETHRVSSFFDCQACERKVRWTFFELLEILNYEFN